MRRFKVKLVLFLRKFNCNLEKMKYKNVDAVRGNVSKNIKKYYKNLKKKLISFKYVLKF